jgi:hypothetical protein
MSFFTGQPGKFEKVSTLRKGGQEGLFNQLQQSLAAGQRGGGAFNEAADYYRNLLGNNTEDFNAFAQPELRRFREQTIPGLAEQFAGFGSGGLDSSGFRNAAVGAGTDLSERLGAIRAQLRQQAAQGLTGLGQLGLQQVDENIYRQGQPGAIEWLAPLIGSAAGTIFGPAGSAIGSGLGNIAKGWFKQRE